MKRLVAAAALLGRTNEVAREGRLGAPGEPDRGRIDGLVEVERGEQHDVIDLERLGPGAPHGGELRSEPLGMSKRGRP